MKTLSNFLGEKAKVVGQVDLGKIRQVTFERPKTIRRKKGEPRKQQGNFVTQADLNALEKVLDKLFAKYDIDIEFTKHFKDRINDARNQKQITIDELRALFQKAYKKAATKLVGLKGKEAVLVDLQSKINVPFVLKVDRNGDLDLVAKTIMRKDNFRTSNPKVKVENMKSLAQFEAESLSLQENLEPKEYMKAAKKAEVLFNRDLRKLFPDQEAYCRLDFRVGVSLEAEVFALTKFPSHIERMNARACARFIMHLTDDFGEQKAMGKFTWEKIQIKARGDKKVVFRKISDKNPLSATLKLLKWFKQNKEHFLM